MLCPYEFTQGARIRKAVHLTPELEKSKRGRPRGLSPRASRRKGVASPAATSSHRLGLAQPHFIRGDTM
jgi:hypothetical protein